MEKLINRLSSWVAPKRPANTHAQASVVEVLGEFEGRRLGRRFEVHYTPKHASWLNAAELEASIV